MAKAPARPWRPSHPKPSRPQVSSEFNPSPTAQSPWGVPAFRRLLVGQWLANFGQAMFGTAIGWHLYERTNSAFVLGLVGLVLVLPVIVLALPAGAIVDRHNRRHVSMWASMGMALSSLGVAALSYFHGPIEAIFACLLVAGTAQIFGSASRSALLGELVPAEHLSRASTLRTASNQFAFLGGPAAAGVLLASMGQATPIFLLDAGLALCFALALAGVRQAPLATLAPQEAQESQAKAEGGRWTELMSGLHFVWASPVLLAAITLDLFAVLFGGVVALLPIFAKDVFHAGPQGLGLLAMATPLGSGLMGVALSFLPPLRRNGPTLMLVVTLFGLASIGFGLAPNLTVAWLCLAVSGAVDMVSMVIRGQLTEVLTPNAMRGRVAAVHTVFVGTSNELGAFESGATAAWLGPVRSVVYGGIGTLAVVAWVAWRCPPLWRLDQIQVPEPEGAKPQAELAT